MDDAELAARLIAGERRALARAITLIESSHPDHRRRAVALLEHLSADPVAKQREAIRLGLSGTPGVGKSTFTEAFGMNLVSQGMRIAVLAIDPSSTRTGGSILGDKTRMPELSRAANAYIRPSPSQTHLGGVARRTREAVRLCEAAGFDLIIIETVGVGQSETLAASMSDLFVLLLAPAGGDELQGVKRGIMETADLILVNKADGDLRPAALRTQADYAGALRLIRKRPEDPESYPKVMLVSALQRMGLEEAWEAMQTLVTWRRENHHWQTRRAKQAKSWFEEEVRDALLSILTRPGPVSAKMTQLANAVETGQRAPLAAAQEMLEQLAIAPRPA